MKSNKFRLKKDYAHERIYRVVDVQTYWKENKFILVLL